MKKFLFNLFAIFFIWSFLQLNSAYSGSCNYGSPTFSEDGILAVPCILINNQCWYAEFKFDSIENDEIYFTLEGDIEQIDIPPTADDLQLAVTFDVTTSDEESLGTLHFPEIRLRGEFEGYPPVEASFDVYIDDSLNIPEVYIKTTLDRIKSVQETGYCKDYYYGACMHRNIGICYEDRGNKDFVDIFLSYCPMTGQGDPPDPGIPLPNQHCPKGYLTFCTFKWNQFDGYTIVYIYNPKYAEDLNRSCDFFFLYPELYDGYGEILEPPTSD